MKTFKEILSEANVVKRFRVGKEKHKAEIVKTPKGFDATIGGDKLDTFKSEKEAEKAINDYAKLMEL